MYDYYNRYKINKKRCGRNFWYLLRVVRGLLI